ncbi:MAG: ABC transporter permease [Myxococcales bacterium]|nr:ABC transporter permease [Myxococcota bacterium]MDW8280172.1 ABC transporter permease [Myxococcales bacterium]
MKGGFELLVAARYLRANRPRKRGWRLRLISLSLLVVTLLLYLLHHLLERRLQAHFDARLYALGPILRYAKYISVLVFVLAAFFVELIRKLSIFTTISTFGLFLGTGALVTVLSVMSGFEQDLKQKILGTHAHMVVTCPDRPFVDYREVLRRIEKLPGVVAGTPYLSSELMIASPSNLSGVVIKGIDPETIGRVTDLVRNTDVGSLDNLRHPERLPELGRPPPLGLPDPGASMQGTAEPPPRRRVLPGVVIGRELAKNLRVYLGDEVNIVSPLGDVGPTGPIPKAKPFRVVAIFFSGMYEYDSKYIYLDLPAAQKFLGMGDEVTGLELKLADPERTEPVMAAVRQALGPGYEVEDWKQLNRSLFSALKLEKIAMFIALCFIIVVAAFSIISNGIMLVMEKGKEVAILKSMGATDGAVLRIFILLGLYMGLLGTGVGIACGSLACLALDRFGIPLNTDVYYIPKLPVNVNPWEILAVLAASLALSLCATIYPAWLASRLRPVRGLRL